MKETFAGSRRRGVWLYILAVFFFALNDALGKWLVGSYAVGQLLFLRSVGAALVLAPMVWRLKVDLSDRRRLSLQVARVVLMALDTFCFYYATRSMPLADVMTFYMATPLMITALSALILREAVEPIRWAAVFLGFLGVVIALKPSPDILATASPYALAGATMYALSQTITRVLRGTHWLHLVVWQFAGAGLLGAATLPFVFVMPGPFDLALTFFLGITAMACFIAMTRALALAPASALAPFQYTAILWASMLGWLVWRDAPSVGVWTGNAFIILSGLFALRAERGHRSARQATSGARP